MQKILLPVDGSESSLRAVRHAVKLAGNNDKLGVTLLYVHWVPAPYGPVAPKMGKGELEKIEREHADPALAEAEKILRDAGINFTRDVIAAWDVGLTIAGRAEELDCDAIVMGKSGGGGLTQLLLGSTANKVAQLSELPVVLVK